MNPSTWVALLAAVVTLAGGALGAAAAVLAAREQQRDQQESAKKINDLNQTIHILNAELYASVTGGDSYGWVDFMLTMNGVEMLLKHEGKSALYDVRIIIRDLDNIDAYEKPDERDRVKPVREMFRSDIYYEAGTVIPKLIRPLGILPLGDANVKEFYITIVARNGLVGQRVRFVRTNGGLELASKVIRKITEYEGDDPPPDQILREDASSNFPKGSDGKVQWD